MPKDPPNAPEFQSTTIEDVLILEPRVYEDPRGFFAEVYRDSTLHGADIRHDFVQENHSGSRQRVLRGLHYQIQHTQGKLVRAVVGEVFDVVVDLRRSSETFGKSASFWLSADNKRLLWIPPGFAHGFYTLSEWAEVIYKTTDYYAPSYERTLLWNDPALGIDWPLIDKLPPILSEKDSAGSPFAKADTYP